MQTPIEVTFRGMERSESLEGAIHLWVARLERVVDKIQRCSVVIEVPHRHQQSGQKFRVRVTVAIPGREIAVSRDRDADSDHEDPYITVADAFRIARRQLLDYVESQREGPRA